MHIFKFICILLVATRLTAARPGLMEILQVYPRIDPECQSGDSSSCIQKRHIPATQSLFNYGLYPVSSTPSASALTFAITNPFGFNINYGPNPWNSCPLGNYPVCAVIFGQQYTFASSCALLSANLQWTSATPGVCATLNSAAASQNIFSKQASQNTYLPPLSVDVSPTSPPPNNSSDNANKAVNLLVSLDASSTEPSTTTEQSTDTSEPSTTEASSTDGSTTDESTTEASSTDGSTTDESTTEASTTEASSTDGSTTDESTTESSTTEESTTDESTTEEDSTSSSSDSSTATTEESTETSESSSTTEESTTDVSTTESSTTTEDPSTSTSASETTEESTTDVSTTESSTATDDTSTSASASETTEESTTDVSTTESSTASDDTSTSTSASETTSTATDSTTTEGPIISTISPVTVTGITAQPPPTEPPTTQPPTPQPPAPEPNDKPCEKNEDMSSHITGPLNNSPVYHVPIHTHINLGQVIQAGSHSSINARQESVGTSPTSSLSQPLSFLSQMPLLYLNSLAGVNTTPKIAFNDLLHFFGNIPGFNPNSSPSTNC